MENVQESTWVPNPWRITSDVRFLIFPQSGLRSPNIGPRCGPRYVGQAQAVVLYYFGDCSVAAVAELMELSEGAVKSHLSRARRTLARKLGTKEDQ